MSPQEVKSIILLELWLVWYRDTSVSCV